MPFWLALEGGGGGFTLMILGLFGLKTGTDFAHFGLELGMVFEGATGMYERIYRFNPKSVRRTQ